jgi:uncharacterized protein YbjT (DUF2867 family)
MPRSASFPIAVVGATGQQGGAVVDALLERGAPVRALVRDPARAAGLAERGAELATVDLEDAASVREAFTGVSAVFAMTTMSGPDGTDGEVRQGQKLADAARDAQVPHLVYSSVGGAERHTGIPHFESKWRVEEYLSKVGVPTVVVRPAFFMENFASGFAPQADGDTLVLRAPLAPDVPLQMIAVTDIGVAAAAALLDPAAVPGGAVEIAGDERTGAQIAEIFGRARGLRARFEQLPLEELDPDAAAMFAWLQRSPAYQADFDLTQALVGDVTDLPSWVAIQAVT